MAQTTVSWNAIRCYLEPMINGINRVFLPDGKEINVTSSFLYDKPLVHLFPTDCSLALTAYYSKSGASLRADGISTIYLDRKPYDTKYCIEVNEGSVLEMSPGAIIYVLQFSNIHKPCVNLSLEPPLDQMSLMAKLYHWEMFTGGQLLTCTSAGFDDKREKVASFDLDRTLIKSKAGGYPRHNNWIWWHESVPEVISKLHEDGYKVIIFTNQAGIMKSQSSTCLHFLKIKIQDVMQLLGVPVQVHIATFLGGLYRKPVPGMWRLMEWNCGVKTNIKNSFFVGDAAGRENDFAASDRIFAENIGVRFYTPEEFFLNQRPPVSFLELKFPCEPSDSSRKMPNLEIPAKTQEVIVIVGPPSSGKTAFVESYLIPAQYVPVSLDYFDDWNVSSEVLSDILRRKRNAVVDHRNWLIIERRKFLQLCKSRQVKVRCFVIDWSVNRCIHNNKFKKMFDANYETVTPALLEQYRNNFETPTVEEGFASVIRIPFIPKFKCDEMKFLYSCYLHAR